MELSQPKVITWWVAVVLAVLGILANLVTLPVLTPVIGFWLVVVAFVLLALGTLLKGL